MTPGPQRLNKMKYYTHGGIMYCDEVAGYTICLVAGVCDEFERLGDITNIPGDGIIADIGRRHDPSTNRFDHHQGDLRRPNGYPLASAGLLWQHFGKLAVYKVLGSMSEEQLDFICARVDDRFIQGIDAHDADSKYKVSAICSGGSVQVMTLSVLISKMNNNPKDEVAQNNAFFKAAFLILDLLQKEIISAQKYIENSVEFDSIAEFSHDGAVVFVPDFFEWKEIVCERYPKVRYVISPSGHPGSPFSMTAVPIRWDSRVIKLAIDRSPEFTGFIHEGKWIAGGEIDDLIALATYNLQR